MFWISIERTHIGPGKRIKNKKATRASWSIFVKNVGHLVEAPEESVKIFNSVTDVIR